MVNNCVSHCENEISRASSTVERIDGSQTPSVIRRYPLYLYWPPVNLISARSLPGKACRSSRCTAMCHFVRLSETCSFSLTKKREIVEARRWMGCIIQYASARAHAHAHPARQCACCKF